MLVGCSSHKAAACNEFTATINDLRSTNLLLTILSKQRPICILHASFLAFCFDARRQKAAYPRDNSSPEKGLSKCDLRVKSFERIRTADSYDPIGPIHGSAGEYRHRRSFSQISWTGRFPESIASRTRKRRSFDRFLSQQGKKYSGDEPKNHR